MGGFERVSDPIVSRDLIGRRSDEVLVEVERGAIRKFAEAVGDTTEACLRGEVAPPTFQREGRLGVMTFVIIDLEARAENGEPVFTGRSTVIVR